MKQLIVLIVSPLLVVAGVVITVKKCHLVEKSIISDEIEMYKNAKKCNAFREQRLHLSNVVYWYVKIGDSTNCAKWSAISHFTDSVYHNQTNQK